MSKTQKQPAASPAPIGAENIDGLDKIEKLFIIYSAAHNIVNAWQHSPNALFFVFVAVGVVSVELMLHTVYKHWKTGRIYGTMETMSKVAGGVALAYAIGGILSTTQFGAGEAWVTFYHLWILPSSAPVMFLFSFLVQSVDPLMKGERDQKAYEHRVSLAERRDRLQGKELELQGREALRKLKFNVHMAKLAAIAGEAGSRRVRKTLSRGARLLMPRILHELGVPVKRVSRGGSRFSFLSAGYTDEDLKLLNEGEGEDATMPGK